jgi:exonuclease III
VVGLGEVMTPAAATKLAAAIGPDWRAVTSTKGVGPPGEQERYAVLYDSDLAKVIGPESWYPDPGDVFARDPWAIDVKAGPFDFTLTLVNLVSGETAAARVAELEHVDDAWRWFQEQDPREQDVIMTGDFNREPDEEGWEQVRQAGLRLLVTGCATTIDVKGRPANLCDQMIIATQETREWTGSAGAIEDVGLGLAEFRSKVSDHLPVSATFGTQGPDDD